MNVKIEKSWGEKLQEEFDQPYFKKITTAIKEDIRNGKTIYPPGNLIFNAFNLTPFDKVKCVLLGQDPYHGPNQANGLCFSVNPGIRQPPSLKNIFKELQNDLGCVIPSSGDLTPWANQGVLLLNAILTVVAHQPASHSKIGWEQFTNAVIKKLSAHKEGIVFILWGRFAQQKSVLIDSQKHFILEATHPSPFSAHKGFFGCKHFSKTNAVLEKNKKSPIQWEIK